MLRARAGSGADHEFIDTDANFFHGITSFPGTAPSSPDELDRGWRTSFWLASESCPRSLCSMTYSPSFKPVRYSSPPT